MSASRRLILFTRFPVSGLAKTRLIPELGLAGAAALQRRLTLRTVRAARSIAEQQGIQLQVSFEGADQAAVRHWLGDALYREQGPGDLGERMGRAVETSFREGVSSVVIIGSDCPELTPELLGQAFETLSERPVVFGPATDGGYYLLGLTGSLPELFRGINWGTNEVLSKSLEVLGRANLVAGLLPLLSDIDRPEDLPVWLRIVEHEEKDLHSISVIIPALNEAQNISQVVTASAAGQPREIIVVDGDSVDETAQRARHAGATVLHCQAGRARQMNYGAAKARGTVLLFLHADTFVPTAYASCVAQVLAQPRVAAGAFSFKVGAQFPGKRMLERITNFRSRRLQMPYGDQGLFLRRSLFEELGGFAPLPILEDYELIRRLRRHGRIVTAALAAQTCGRRWERLGLMRTTLINQVMLIGFHLGWPAEKLAAIYRTTHRAQ